MPGVQMCIKMEHRYGAVDFVQASESCESKRVVAAQGDDLGVLQGRGDRCPMGELEVRGGHLRESNCIVDRRYGNVATV